MFLLVVLARWMEPEQVGIFGLVVVTISMGVYLIGMDYYVLNTREILAAEEGERAGLVRDQFAFHLFMYAVAVPVVLLVLATGVLPWGLAAWLYVLLVLEHFVQELQRLLITLGRPIRSSMVLFIRAGAWVYGWAGIAAAWEPARSLDLVWAYWCAGLAGSLVLGMWWLRDIGWRSFAPIRLQPGDAWRKARSTLPLFATSVAQRVVVTADRFILEATHGPAAVGVYTFFAGIADSVNVFAETGVAHLIMPRAVAANQQNRMDEYRLWMRRLAVGLVLILLVLVGLVWVLIGPLLAMLARPEYDAGLPVLGWLLGRAAVATLSLVPHYGLYARRKDLWNLAGAVVGLVAMLAIGPIITGRYGPSGAAAATLIAIGVMGVLKAAFSVVVSRRSERGLI